MRAHFVMRPPRCDVTFASARKRNRSGLTHSSRNLPLKLSVTPFCEACRADQCRARFVSQGGATPVVAESSGGNKCSSGERSSLELTVVRRIGVAHLLRPTFLSLLSRSAAESPLAKKSTTVTVAFKPSELLDSLASLISAVPGEPRTEGTTLRARASSAARTRTTATRFT
jgi:hypothetical protein